MNYKSVVFRGGCWDTYDKNAKSHLINTSRYEDNTIYIASSLLSFRLYFVFKEITND